MSKRARITLDLEPDAAIEETSTATKPKAASKPKARARPKARAERQAGSGAGEKTGSHRAAKPNVRPESANPDTASGAKVVPPPRKEIPPAESAARSDGRGMPSLPSGLNLGTLLKVAAVGVIVVSAVLWLKRRP